MSSLSTLPKGDSAWLLRKSIQRIMQQVSVLETNIGSSTTGNSANTQVIFNDNGTLRGDTGLTFNKTTDTLGTGRLTTSGDAIVCSSTGDFYVGSTVTPQFKVERATGSATITGDLTVDTSTLKVDSANNRVGIGTASPATAFQVVGEIRSSADISNSSDAVIYSYAGGSAGTVRSGWQLIGSTPEIRAYLSGSTAMTLNSTGLGVGLSAHIYKLQSVGFVAASSSTVNGSGGNLIGALLNSDDANSGVNPGLDIRRWTGTALNHGVTYIGTNATGDTLFYNGSVSSNTRATSLKMTLDASGNLLVGTTSSLRNTAHSFKATGASTAYWAAAFQQDGTTSGGRCISLDLPNTNSSSSLFVYATNSSGYAFGVLGNGSLENATGSYGTISDLRLKENISDARNYLADLLKLRVVKYSLKSEASAVATKIGFIAQEVEQVFPTLVETNTEDVKSIKTTVLIPMLLKAIQELTARVEALEA